MSKKPNILVVDDDAAIRDLFTRALGSTTYELDTAENGEKALNLAQQRPFDLAFVDLKMPGLDGLEIFRLFKNLHPNIGVVMITGLPDEEKMDAAMREGVLECVIKPFDIRRIKSIIEKRVCAFAPHPSAETADQTSRQRALGRRIRELRNQREMTLEQLAGRIGVTFSFLSQVERGVVSPSIESLQKISNALGAKIGSFFEEEDCENLTLIRKVGRPRTVDEATRLITETLIPGLLNSRMEPQLFTLEAGGGVGGELGAHVVEAFGFVLEGEVEFIRGKGERLALSKGDGVYLRRPRSYRIVNGASEKAKILWVAIKSGT